MMSTARISVNVDGEVKQNAQKILSEIGMDLTTAIDLLLRTIVREERIPFNLQTEKAYREDTYKHYVKTELEKSKQEVLLEIAKYQISVLDEADQMKQSKAAKFLTSEE